ncbi:MAG: threonine/serine exporter family protein [Rikenellaceae bacterium]
MSEKKELFEVAELLIDVGAALMGAGSHTSRVVRNVTRMAESFGYEVFITVFQKNITMMVRKKGVIDSITLVRPTKAIALNFRIVSDLSQMSWQTHDNDWSVEIARSEYNQIMSTPRLSRWIVLILVACANASFCKLFNGDFISCLLVFAGTLTAFFVRQELMNRHANHLFIFFLASFISSSIASIAFHIDACTTPDIAQATSVLFLIPGVPLINSMIDIMEGHVLTGIARLVNATMLIICLSIGFFVTLQLFS